MPRRVRYTDVTVVDPLAPPTEPAPLPVPEPTPTPEPAPLPVPEPDEVPAPVMVPTRPISESTLTPEQRRIRDLENQLAIERGRKEPVEEIAQIAQPGATENIVIHFLEDGFTALNRVWMRGQELEFEPNGQSYAETCDRHGWSWVELRNDEFAQVGRYGKVMFRNGPWPGKSLLDVASVPFDRLVPLSGEGNLVPSLDALRSAQQAEERRGRAAPRLNA